MPLTKSQVHALRLAMRSYAFPAVYYDFGRAVAVPGLSMRQVESLIGADLRSGLPSRVRNGLSNVLYWGYTQMGGLAQFRTDRFRTHAFASSLAIVEAARLFSRCQRPTLFSIGKLRLPEFSGVSFVSKVRMFLDPVGSATLDQQIMKIHAARAGTVLACVTFRPGATQIPVTKPNSLAYEAWCGRLYVIARSYFPSGTRVVDVERAFFHLVQTGGVHVAARILFDA